MKSREKSVQAASFCPELTRSCSVQGDAEPILLTCAEFCAVVRLSARQYYRMRAAGDGPRIVRMSGKVMVPREEVSRWLAEHTGPAPGVSPRAYQQQRRAA